MARESRQTRPPPTILHPPWRRLAESLLKNKDPQKYRELKRAGMLEEHLNELDEAARTSYEVTVRQIEELNPGKESWALQSAQEMVIRDLLDPTT
jgi:hypothetical protein